ncbi:MAG: ATP-binding protein [Dehalococcoidia bacterium]
MPGPDASRPARPPRRRAFAGVRERLSSAHPGTQLAAVAVPIILLLTAAALTFAWRGYERSVQTAEYESRLLAAAAAVDAERFLANRIETLAAVSTAPVFRQGNLNDIHDYLSQVVDATGFSEIGWIDTTGYGLTVGGAPLLREPLYVGDRPHIARALQTGEPVVGAAQISRVSQEPTVNVVLPVKDGTRIVALLAGAVRLNGPKTTDLRFGNVDGLRVVDGQGNLAVIGERQDLRELRNVSEWPPYAAIRDQREGVIRAEVGVLGGEDRLIGFAPVAGSDWLVLVDRSQQAVFGDALNTLRVEVALATMFAACSLLVVVWAAWRLDTEAERFVLFVDTLAHDVGTPLTVIRAYASRLQRSMRDDPSRLASITEIDRAGRRIERMVQALADLLGPTGRPALVRTELDLAALVREMVEEYELRTGRTIRYQPGVPSMVGEWDGLRVERLVDNLLSNAIKYSPSDSEVMVRLSAEGAEPRLAVLEVRDFGIGIPEAEQRAIWRRFRRGSNTGGVPGKGVGLASVQQIAQEHGGSVHLRSSAGQGTAVTVRLPWPEDRAPGADEDGGEPVGASAEGGSRA